LEEQIRPTTAEVYDLRATISILLQSCAFEAVECVRDALAAAHDTLVLIIAKGTLIANPHERRWAHVRITDRAFPVAFVAKTADGDAGLLAAHNEISEQPLAYIQKRIKS
jgi:hypothetical protein